MGNNWNRIKLADLTVNEFCGMLERDKDTKLRLWAKFHEMLVEKGGEHT